MWRRAICRRAPLHVHLSLFFFFFDLLSLWRRLHNVGHGEYQMLRYRWSRLLPQLIPLTMVMTLTLRCFSSCGQEIPCTNSSTTSSSNAMFAIHSNATYTLTDCTSDLPFIGLTPTSLATTLENVIIRVQRGTALPCLQFHTFYSMRMIRNIHVLVDNVVVSVSMTNSVVYPPSANSILDLSGGYQLVSVENVSITIVNSSISLNVSSATSSASSSIAPLWYLSTSANGVVISGFHGTIQNCNVSVAVHMSSAAGGYQNVVAIAAVGASYSSGGTSVLHVVIQVVNSSLTLSMTSAASPAIVKYLAADPAIFCLRSGQGVALLQDVAVTSSGGSRFFVRVEAPSTSSDIASVLSLRFAAMRDIVVDLQWNTVASVDTICGGDDCRTTLASNYPSARIVEIQAASNASNHSIRAHGCTFWINSPKSALVFTWQNIQRLSIVLANVSDCSFHATGTKMAFVGATRSQALVKISGNDNVTQVGVVVERASVYSLLESGGCQAAASCVVQLLDNVSFSTVRISNATINSTIANGTSVNVSQYSLSLTTLTMSTTILNLGMQAPTYVNIGMQLNIFIVNATIDAMHATTLPAASTVILVVSVMSVVNVVRFLENCTMVVDSSHVRRSFVTASSSSVAFEAAGSLPTQGANLTVTSIMNLFDALSTALGINQELTFHSDYFFQDWWLRPSRSCAQSNIHTNDKQLHDIGAAKRRRDSVRRIQLDGPRHAPWRVQRLDVHDP